MQLEGDGVYRGCIDSPAVTFNYFGVGGSVFSTRERRRYVVYMQQ